MSSNKPVIIEIQARDGASRVIKPLVADLHDLDDAGNRAADGAGQAGAGIDKAGDAAGGAKSKLDGLVGTIEKVSSAAIVMQSVNKVLDFTDAGTSIKTVTDAYNGLASSAKINSQTLLQSLRTASRGYITDMELMQGANKALLTGGTELANALPKLLEISGAAAKAQGKDVKQMYSDLVEGITKNEPEILDNLGLTINLTQVYDTYAKTLGKTANELTTTEKSTALLNEVMKLGDGYIQKIGGSANVTGQSIANLRTSWTNFMNDIKASAAIGLEQVLSGGQYLIDETNRMVLEAGASYARYRQILAETGQEGDGLSEAQYKLAQSLMASGQSANDAANNAQALTGTQGELATALQRVAGESGLSEQAQAALIDRTLALAASSPEAAAGVSELIDELGIGRGSLEEFTAGLADGEAMALNHASAIAEDASMMQLAQANADYAAASTDNLSASIYQLTTDQYNQTDASLQAAIAAENEARFQDDLAAAVAASGDNAALAAYFSAQLSGQYGIEASKVQNLITLHNQLHIARAKGQGNAAGLAAAAVVNRATDGPGGLEGYHERNVDRAERAERARAPKGRGGAGRKAGGGGKSDAVKEQEREEKELKRISDRMEKEAERFNERMQKLDEEHVAREKKIWDDYYQKQLAALKKFNSDKFKDELGFKDSLKGMDQAARDAMIVEERKAWDEAQAIAQAGNPKLADEYYKLKLDQIKANQERADELAAIEKEISETTDAEQKRRLEQERAYLQQLDAEHDKYDAEDLQKLKDGGDQLAKERDEQLAEEELRYAEAGATLKEEYAKNVASIIDEGGKIAAVFADIALAAAQAAADARAAVASIPAAPGAAGESGAAAPAGPAPDGSYALGLKRVPRDGFIAELHKDERILTANEARDYTEIEKYTSRGGAALRDTSTRVAGGGRANELRDNTVHDNPSRVAGGGSTSGSGGHTFVIAPNFTNSTAPRHEVALASNDIEALIRKVVKEEAKKDQRINRAGG